MYIHIGNKIFTFQIIKSTTVKIFLYLNRLYRIENCLKKKFIEVAKLFLTTFKIIFTII